ncbi:GDP-L-fucose synthase [Candidatus Roizmanbacteria bacterium]|nr:GDP-L-fucose synthase [Candidatus Roizmanbacteria bacterium]
MNLTDKRILLTGGSGFVGAHVFKKLILGGFAKENIFIPKKSEYDLRDKNKAIIVTKKIDYVIHLAGNVGGIKHNQLYPGEMFYDNITIGVNLIEAARRNKVKKFLCIGTICSYPKLSPIPFAEENLWLGYPDETNAPYAIAKLSLLVMLQAYRKQYGFNGIYLLPVNMYGPGDNFDPKKSHVIAALIKKMVWAKENKLKSVEIWGNGTATREFLYVEDAALGIVKALKKYNKSDPINLGVGKEISIKKLAEKIKKAVGFKGQLIWNKEMPNGQPRRCLDVSKANKEFGFKAKTKLTKGLKKTVDWYIKNS